MRSIKVTTVAKKNDQGGEVQKKTDQATTQAAQQQKQQTKVEDPKATANLRPLKYNEQGQPIRYVRLENERTKDGE